MLSTHRVPMCPRACPQLGPGVGKEERGADRGGGDLGSPSTPARTHILICTNLLSFLLSLSVFLPSRVSPSLSPSAVALSLLLFLISSFISLGVF